MEVRNLDLPIKLVVDPKMDQEELFKPSEILYKGATNKSIYAYRATTINPSLLMWNNICPPSLQTCVERTLRVQYTLTLVVTVPNATDVGTATGPLAMDYSTVAGAVGIGGVVGADNHNICLRAFPLYGACSSIELKLNGNSTSVSPWDVASLYPHLLHQDELQEFSSEFPCQKDNSALYTVYDPATGDNKNPFANPSANSYIPSRSSYIWRVVAAGTPAAATPWTYTYQVTVVEQLIISPMLYGNRMNAQALANINNITLNMKIADLTRTLSVVYPLPPNNSFTLNIDDAFLLVEYSTPDPILSSRMPPSLTYDYETIVSYPTDQATPITRANSNPIQIKLQAIQLPSIPNKLSISIRQSEKWRPECKQWLCRFFLENNRDKCSLWQ